MTDETEDDYDERPPDSDPLCVHWLAVWDCDEACFRCGHPCSVHHGGGRECDPCYADGGCECPGFLDCIPSG